ncbi:aminotransferase class IV family protein [Stenotrophomonas sp. YIM B06876]|uniref:aminotransferase class IV family protein n=1 Tax=Stenotrophomonas sp. YIM B06876 TaxID=3060211 RepID=UPI0027391826|nr:aminotransferase class IV family protein [Stenotrophomonas sp. YIM B06876]
MSRIFCNGYEATAEALAAALTNYGHFTSMQVRGSAVQGLDLHLQRLQQGTQALFSSGLDEAQLRGWLRAALAACGVVDASLRITVLSRQFDFRQPLSPVPVDVLVSVAAPVPPADRARALCSVAYSREMPHLKHLGTFALFQHRRQALQAGYDDAVFVDGDGHVSEGTTWNLALWDGRRVHWPQAPALRGTTEQLLMDGLASQGGAQTRSEVALAALDQFSGAIACNSAGIWPISRIDRQPFPDSASLLAMLRPLLDTRPWQPL